MAKKEVKHVYKYSISLEDSYLYRTIYTNDELVKYNPTEDDEFDDSELKRLYFTPEKIQELKDELCKRIQESQNPFDISLNDLDGGYEVDEKNIINFKI